jgi:hypothetical protein
MSNMAEVVLPPHNITSHHHIVYLCIAGCLLCSFFVRTLKLPSVLVEHRIVTSTTVVMYMKLIWGREEVSDNVGW